MTKESKVVRSFLNVLKSSNKTIDRNTGMNTAQKRIDRVCNYLSELTDKELKRLVSDKHWNKYPFYLCYPASASSRSYGQILGTVVHELCQYNSRARKVLIESAEGIFLSYTIDYTYGKDRLKASRKALKSKDSRARLRAAKVLPVSRLKNLVSDSNASVRNVVIKRIGIDNCAESLVDDKCSWIRTRAISAADSLSDEDVRGRIDKLKDVKDTASWYRAWEMLALIQKLSDEELLYFLDLGDRWSRISEHIKKRLEYANIEIKPEAKV